jgi:alpha/beta superfamily hydrolase
VPIAAEPVALDTADGLTLEAEALLPPAPWAAVAMCHPHPLYGGDMHNIVVEAVVRALAGAGVAALRFNFRGVGGSEGRHGDGREERLDAAAAVDAVAPFAGDGPLVLAGYSFGAVVALSVLDARLAGWFAVAPALAHAEPGALVAAGDHRPKLIVAPDHDQFTPPAAVADMTSTWAATTIEPLAMADHFLAGRTGPVADAAVAFVRSLAAR